MLTVEGLSAGYGDSLVFRELSLSVSDGEFVALVGSNNAGKSTLANAITGRLRTRAGTKTWHGRDVTNAPTRDLARLGVVQVPEGHQLFPDMTVEENLHVGGMARTRSQRLRHEAMNRAFQIFPRLRERLRQHAGSLSGGEQQMLAIACGLMAEPELLILDEPSLGLAPGLVQAVFAALTELNEHGVAILVIEQNLKISLAHATRGYVLERGEIVLAAPAADLAADPRVTTAYLGLG